MHVKRKQDSEMWMRRTRLRRPCGGSADSPSRCVHAAWGSCRERRSSGRSFLRSSHPSCTGWDLKEGPDGKDAHVRIIYIDVSVAFIKGRVPMFLVGLTLVRVSMRLRIWQKRLKSNTKWASKQTRCRTATLLLSCLFG